MRNLKKLSTSLLLTILLSCPVLASDYSQYVTPDDWNVIVPETLERTDLVTAFKALRNCYFAVYQLYADLYAKDTAGTAPVQNAEATFDRVIEIDGELNRLIEERNNIISQKTNSERPFTEYATVFREGQYKIGSEMPAGEYIFFATGEYSGRIDETRDSNGSDRVDSEYFSYNLIYTVTDGNYISIEDAVAVPYNLVPALITNKGDGMFKVGVHIPAGEYRLIPTEFGTSASFTVYNSSLLSSYDSRVDSEYFKSLTYITVRDGDYLKIDDCLFVE